MAERKRRSVRAWAAAAAAITLGAVLLYANLTTPDQPVEHPIAHRYDTRHPQFLHTMAHLLGAPVVPGNRVTTLLNGDQAFPAMLEAIRSAQHSITLEAYIFWPGTVGTMFAEALAERARAGVATHLILDGVGSQKLDEELIERMRQAGVQVVKFRPIHWYTLDRVNHRTHRKLLVVDGRVGFTGGLGIADLYLGHAQDADHWRDGQFRAEGPVVGQLQAAFLDNWIESGEALLHGLDYFPPLDSAGGALAQAIHSSPGDGTENLRLMYHLAIASASRSILIGNPYFVPNTLAVEMLVEARRRGVRVEIIVPGPITDAGLVRRASRAKWGPLLEAGVRIYEYQPTMYHNKVIVVDDYWVSVGSTNFDNRSFRLNDEANLNVFDEAFARAQAAIFAQDRARAREVTLEEWRGRPLTERIEERVAWVLRRQL
ncbi:MAG: cardiolipin synthase B [Gemmatimonadales bacterium]|nr:cardiolipin synthase B [Gemmatimonadales bacterium]